MQQSEYEWLTEVHDTLKRVGIGTDSYDVQCGQKRSMAHVPITAILEEPAKGSWVL